MKRPLLTRLLALAAGSLLLSACISQPGPAPRATGDLGLVIERASGSVQLIESTGQSSLARIEDLDAARFVVAHGDQPAVLADGAANAVAALDHPLVDALLEQVDLGQSAVAPEHVGVAFVAGKHHRGM